MIDNEQVIQDSPEVTPGVPNTLPEGVQTAPSESEQKPQPTPQEERFKSIRMLKEKAERERDEAIQMYQKSLHQQQPQQQAQNLNIGNEDLAEGKHLKALQDEIVRLRDDIKEHKQTSNTMTAEARLRSSYPDIEKVVSKENMQVLSVQEPEIFDAIQSTQDFYAKGVAAYKALKKFGIHIDDTYEPDRQIAQANAAKPRPSASISTQKGDTPLSHANAFANGLTEELKAQLYKEMLESRRNH